MLKEVLEENYQKFHSREFLYSDPLKFVHGYSQARDQEVVAYIAASLAYGRVEQILKNLERIFFGMGESPFEFILNFCEKDLMFLGEFIYRFNKREDIVSLIYILQTILQKHKNIENFFTKNFKREEEKGIKYSISDFSKRAIEEGGGEAAYGDGKIPDRYGVRWFFSDPYKGGASKRINLFLRWMVRDDEIDLGLWKTLKPSDLYIPLDIHLARISKEMGLTHRNQPNWLMVDEITKNLKTICPTDPIKYDFSICRIGILKTFSKKKD